jgi:hypothetical protein
MKPFRLNILTKTLCLGCALIGSVSLGLAQDANKLEKLEKENADLRRRLEALEQKEGITPSGTMPKVSPVKALSDITISGFVTASYFYDTSTPHDRKSNGYLWNTTHNSFSINKVKLTLASAPAERSGDKWDAAFRTSFIWGEDSALVNTGGETQGLEGLREAFVELNAPLGTGLNIKAVELRIGGWRRCERELLAGVSVVLHRERPVCGGATGLHVHGLAGLKGPGSERSLRRCHRR